MLIFKTLPSRAFETFIIHFFPPDCPPDAPGADIERRWGDLRLAAAFRSKALEAEIKPGPPGPKASPHNTTAFESVKQ